MTKVNVVLALALVASSLYLVKTSHEARTVFAALDRERSEEARLEADYKRLEAERQQQATTHRVERTARERLGMRATNPAMSQYVQDAAGPAVRATAASAPSSGAAVASTVVRDAVVSPVESAASAARR